MKNDELRTCIKSHAKVAKVAKPLSAYAPAVDGRMDIMTIQAANGAI